MGNFSRDTFDKLKHYVGVRLQQGVPIVDADWNEMEDIRKYELQAFLKWFVGNGVPYNNDGFEITAVAAANDFAIQGGDDTADGAGRCLVDGLDVMNESTLNYTAQTLYDNAALATDWGLDPLPPLSTPSSDRTDTVYLDVWEREVDSTEDPDLINAAIGIETAVRRKREWVVRVAVNAADPPAPPAEHAHYPLAYLNRAAGNANITTAMIVDRRTKGLRLPSYYDIQQITRDAFGSSYTLDNDGQPNLPVSLRDAINALMRGGLPATPEQQLTPAAAFDLNPSSLYADNGDIWLFWNSNRSGNNDIWYKQYTRATNTWGVDTQLTTDTNADFNPVAVEDSSGDIWVVWLSNRSGSNNIWFNRYNATTGWQGDTNLSDNANNNVNPMAVADSSGGVWVFWYSNESGNNDIWFNRYTPGTDWQGNERRTTSTDNEYNPYAVAASNGDIWLFWQRTTGTGSSSNTDIWSARYDRSTDAWQSESRLTTNSAIDQIPVAVEDGSGSMWVFWQSFRGDRYDIWYKRYFQPGGFWLSDTALTTDVLIESNFSLLSDTTGRIWVFWDSPIGGYRNISYKTYTTESGWGRTLQLTSAPDYDFASVAIEDRGGKVHAFWVRYTSDFTASDLWTRVLTPQI